MFRNSDWNQIIFENKQLRYDFLGAPDVSHVIVNGGDGRLFEAINTMIESVTNKGFSDFESEGKAYEFILEHLTREVIEEEKSAEADDAPNLGDTWEFITKLAVNNFNERYEHLNESEKEVLNVLISTDSNKVEYLEEIKNTNISLIDNLLESPEANQHTVLKEFKEKLERMDNISPDVIDTFIIECIDLKQELEGIKTSL